MASLTANIKNRLVENATLVILAFLMIVSAVLSIAGYTVAIFPILLLPALLILLSSVRLAAWLFVFSIFVSMHLSDNPPLILADATALILFGSFAVDFLLNGKREISLPSISKYFLALFITILVLSIFSYNYTYAATSLLRILAQVFIIIVLFNAFNAVESERLIKVFFWFTVIHSIYNLSYFFAAGGNIRIFGFAGAYFDDICMLAWSVGLAYFLWHNSRRSSFLFGIGSVLVLLGLIGTQSRAGLFTLIWVSIIIIGYSWYKARKIGRRIVLSRLRFLILTGTVFGVILTFFGYLAGTIERFRELPEIYSGTVWLRLSLWRTSLHAFLQNPLTGVGPGTFRHIETIYPVLRFDAARLYLKEPSAHNLLLHYLAETGLIGTIVLLAVFLKNLLTSIKLVRLSDSGEQTAISIGLLGAGLVIFGSIFYMDGWMWGQNAHAAPLFFAVTARLVYNKHRQLKTDR